MILMKISEIIKTMKIETNNNDNINKNGKDNTYDDSGKNKAE